MWFFLPIGSSDRKGLLQLYLELVDAYKKRFIPQNGQAAVLTCSSIWKKIRNTFTTLSELKLKFIAKAWKREATAHKTPLKGYSLKIEILTRLLYFFYSNLKIWFSCLKTWWICHGWARIFLSFLGSFLSTLDKRNKL